MSPAIDVQVSASGASPKRRLTAGRAGAALLLALAVGCAEATEGLVAGTVTIDGAPAKEGSIAFFPTNGAARTAGAEIIDGQYSARVALGTCKVEIRVPKKVGQKKLYDTADSPVKDVLAESLPARYNDASELTLEVEPGDNAKDWALTTQ